VLKALNPDPPSASTSDQPSDVAISLQANLEAMTAQIDALVSEWSAETPAIQPPRPASNATTATRVKLSFVIPAMDEEATIGVLCEQLLQATPSDSDLEIILIDDGSGDATWSEIERMVSHPEFQGRATIHGIRFRSNAGKAAALTAGFRRATGDLVFTMDADLQDDPQEIPRFLEQIEQGADVVTGWKRSRHDPWHKVLPSRVFNWMLSRLTGVKLHDHNCGFKCYKADVARQVAPHGELHRMMPCLAAMHGFRTVEIEVQHHPRRFGKSKYGFERLARGLSDMLTVAFLAKFGERPAHFINAVARVYLVAAFGLGVGALVVGVGSAEGLLLGLAGAFFAGLVGATFVAGLIAEMVIRDGRMERRTLPIAEEANRRASPAQVTHRPNEFLRSRLIGITGNPTATENR